LAIYPLHISAAENPAENPHKKTMQRIVVQDKIRVAEKIGQSVVFYQIETQIETLV
jgi:hypothetical protein